MSDTYRDKPKNVRNIPTIPDPRNREDHHFGNNRKAKAKTKRTIRQRDRRKFNRMGEEIGRVAKRSHHSYER